MTCPMELVTTVAAQCGVIEWRWGRLCPNLSLITYCIPQQGHETD